MKHAVYAGSFDPITNGHLWMIQQGAQLFHHLTVAIGSNPAKKYLFSLDERLTMLRETTSDLPNVTISSYENLFLIDYAHLIDATFILRGIRNEQDYAFERSMRYVNAEFDPAIQTVFLIPPRNLIEISSSFIKGLVGPAGWEKVLPNYVPPAVMKRFLTLHPHLQS